MEQGEGAGALLGGPVGAQAPVMGGADAAEVEHEVGAVGSHQPGGTGSSSMRTCSGLPGTRAEIAFGEPGGGLGHQNDDAAHAGRVRARARPRVPTGGR